MDAPDPTIGFAVCPGGERIAYGVAGSGPPLVMLPGWLSHVRELWTHPAAASALARFVDGHQFVWYDRLGCGLSDTDRTSTSVDDDVDQLIAILDHLEITRASLIGYSLGGPPAVTFAARHPERVHHLVLYSSFARGADIADAELYQALTDLVRSGWDLAASTLASVFLPKGSGSDLRWFARFQRLASSPDRAADLLEQCRGVDVRDQLAEVRVPTTVISPSDSQFIPMERARELAAGIPAARLVTVDGRTHDPFIRDVGDVVETILAAVEGRERVGGIPDTGPEPEVVRLSPREVDVLRVIADGAPNKQVAAELGVSVATVERHLTNIYRKLDATGRADAAVKGLRLGLLDS